MTNLEIAFNILAEASATELSKQQNPNGYVEQKSVAKAGGGVAKVARNQLEEQLGRTIISPKKASDYILGYICSLIPSMVYTPVMYPFKY